MNVEIESRLNSLGTTMADVDERFIRGSGPGGQKINKSSSCVSLRHRPTGIEVRCQRERSQATNREIAWAELCEKLAGRLRLAAAAKQDEVQRGLRQKRQKSKRQKARLVASKRHRAGIKARRGRPFDD
jgi:protein subunit release factor B